MRRRLLPLALAAVLLAGACTGRSIGSPDGDDLQARAGGVLRVAVSGVASLDPAQARSIDQQFVADQLFDGLTAYDPDTSEVVPALAVRWQSSADQRQWDFFLRPGATFSNGRPVTSADVKYSLERVARPGSGSPAADLLTPVAGFGAFTVRSAPGLAGVATPSPEVVHIALDQPMASLPSVLGNPLLAVVPREAVEAEAPLFAEQPVGSGPFVLRERRGEVLSLVPAPGRNAYVAGLELVVVADTAAGYRAFRDGEVDVAQVPPGEVEDAARRYGRAAFRPYVAQLFYGFNLRNPKLADVRFREAIVRAIDRRAVAKAVYGGTVQALDGMVAAGAAGWQPDPCPRCAHDPARARALLAEVFAGGQPPEVQLGYDDDEAQRAVANAIQAALSEVGIRAVPLGKSLREYRDFAVSGQQELFRLGWIARYPSVDDFLPPLFQTGSPNNLIGFSDPAVDQHLQQARAEPDPDRRLELYRAAERAIMDHVPVIPLAQFQLHLVTAPRVRGVRVGSMGSFDASTAWLAGGR